MSFGEELSKQLNLVAGFRPSQPYQAPVSSKRGFNQRLAYILSPKTGVSLDRAVELTGVSRRTIRAWLGGRTPSKASRAKVDRVYTDFLATKDSARMSKLVRRVTRTVASLKVHITNADGEERFYPPGRNWPQLVDLWSRGDASGMDSVWSGIIAHWDYADAWEPDLIESTDIV